MTHLRLRDLATGARIGIVCLVLVLLGGTAASGAYLAMHHENRDERPGLSIDDVRAHYHGVVSRAPLVTALESGHPENLHPDQRDSLLEWLRTPGRLGVDYDNLDLGDNAPSEIMALSCTVCHSRGAAGTDAIPDMPLEFWDDVQPLAMSREINPVSTEILAASTHTHALGLASVTLILGLLACLTAAPRALVGGAVGLAGAGLLADIGGWWLTRMNDAFAYLVVGGGLIYSAAVVALGLIVLYELVRPTKAAQKINER